MKEYEKLIYSMDVYQQKISESERKRAELKSDLFISLYQSVFYLSIQLFILLSFIYSFFYLFDLSIYSFNYLWC